MIVNTRRPLKLNCQKKCYQNALRKIHKSMFYSLLNKVERFLDYLDWLEIRLKESIYKLFS